MQKFSKPVSHVQKHTGGAVKTFMLQTLSVQLKNATVCLGKLECFMHLSLAFPGVAPGDTPGNIVHF